jgi:hypothetical protein
MGFRLLGVVLVILLAGCTGSSSGTLQDLGAITVQVPDAWRTESPASSMRKAQYALAKQGEDQEDAALLVFYFGPTQGGSVEANLARWFGQFKQPDGRPSKDAAVVSGKQIDGMSVSLADVTGTYAPSAMGPMAPAASAKADYRMLAAIVESPAGSYYFKLTGPEGTVGHWSDAFSRFVDSIKKK